MSVNYERTCWYPEFFQKKRMKKINHYNDTSVRLVFVRFLEELKTPKSPFEIKWPLNGHSSTDSVALVDLKSYNTCVIFAV